MKRILFVGGGKGCRALLEMFHGSEGLEVTGVVDRRRDAPGMRLAMELGIPTSEDPAESLKKEDYDIVINVTGDPNVSEEISKRIPSNVEVVEGGSAKVLWELVESERRSKEEIEKARRGLETLHKVGLKLSASKNLKDALRIILSEAMLLTSTPAGSISLYNRDTKEMGLFIQKGFSRGFASVRRWKVRRGGLTDYILKKKEPLAIEDIEKHPFFDNPVFIKEGIKSLIACPLFADHRIIGILYVDDFTPRPYPEESLSLLSLLAQEASLLIERFRLFEELKEKNWELEMAKDYLKKIIDDSPDVIITTDREGRIVEFSPGAERILGYKRGEMVGMYAKDLYLNPEERARVIECIKNGDNLLNYETTLKAKDGRAVDISLSISHLHDMDENVIGTVGISKDITAEKGLREELKARNLELKELNERLEEKVKERTAELEKANAELERSNRYKSEFIANMSHELRTPLNSVIGFSEFLLEQPIGALNEKQNRYITNILTSGRHLLQLINNILDMAKIEAGRARLDLEKFSCLETVREVEGIIKPLLDKKGLPLSVEVEKGLIVTADRTKFKQILYNLLSNAIKFTEEGGITLRVKRFENEELRVSRPPISKFSVLELQPSILVRVSDTGIGIKKEDIELVFREFEQVDRGLTRRYGGTGLGLPLTKRFIEIHGGVIWVESEKDKGSTFSFVLPSLDLEIPKPVEFMPSYSKDNGEWISTVGREESPLILVVEDDLPTSELLTLYLAQEGYRVAHAYDGEEAIEKAKKIKPFCILLDIMLPKKDGWEVLQTLKNMEETQDIPVFVITSKGLDKDEKLMLMGQIDSILQKGTFSKDELLDEIRRVELLYPKRAGLIDAATGLFNIHYLRLRLQQEIKRVERYKKPFSFILIDIDNFKMYSEKNGPIHAEGVVRKIAELIKKDMRGADIPVKVKGDEFGLILPCTMKPQAAGMAKRLCKVIEGYPFFGEEAMPQGKLTVSIGVVTCPDDSITVESILKQAREALLTAKGRGKNNVFPYGMTEKSDKRDRGKA